MKTLLKIGLILTIVSISIWGHSDSSTVKAQAPVELQCGDIVEGEFTEDMQPHNYVITMAPGDQIDVSATPLGDTLRIALGVYAPNNDVIGVGGDDGVLSVIPSADPVVQPGVLSARGNYTIIAYNARITDSGVLADDFLGGVGVYTLFIGCTLRDGTVIEPRSAPPVVETNSSDTPSNSQEVPVPAFGFPGLAPVDFSNGVTIPLQLNLPNTGSISPGFEGIFGYAFEANAGDTFNLEFNRLTGNLNLGLVVLSDENQVVFQASLLNSNGLTSDFTIFTSGNYTIGIYQMNLLQIDSPESTSFTIQLN